jgi:hypothetical protein
MLKAFLISVFRMAHSRPLGPFMIATETPVRTLRRSFQAETFTSGAERHFAQRILDKLERQAQPVQTFRQHLAGSKRSVQGSEQDLSRRGHQVQRPLMFL